ncbi:1972e50c-1deb-4fde-92c7-5f8019fc6b56 [Sclerotinia trifoliorum]|uniref:1972e50c-1deb-4fde-92c7-5f8019fc6b56 n=1 Tax=Sclerotinia trifoliorum TaxID=28548 RepID=A0A8H2VWQ6_9HELO|nr:1972e50c-1deb-4fde-92c7-5f8019fc6b56 [Sclerotinia trifoliorum]
MSKTKDEVSANAITSGGSNDDTDHDPGLKTTSWWRHIVGYIWDSAEGTPRDRRYVQKIDAYMFTAVCLGYFIKYLDQTNYSNAFVSGMQEDLHLYGNQRNWLNTWFSLGIMVGSVPAMMVQLRGTRSSYFLPCCEIVWSALVMGMAAAKTIETMYVLRFFIGLFEACSFPGYVALLGGWYGPAELTKRVAILGSVESIASMFSGYLQAGLYTSLNGSHGIAGWRWLFIMDAAISIPIAVWGFFAIPDLPHNTKAFYLNADDRKYSIERVEKLGISEPVKLTWKICKKVFLNLKLWAFIFPYVMLVNCHSATSYFNLWLKAEGYSVVKRNILPTAGNALTIVVSFVYGIIADRTGRRFLLINVLMVIIMVSNIMLSVWNIPKPALMAAYYLSYAGTAATPVLISWGNQLNAADPNLRQLLVAAGNVVSFAWVLWVPLVLFPTYDAPKYKYGYQILVLFAGLGIVGTCLMVYIHKRDDRKREVPQIECVRNEYIQKTGMDDETKA